MRSMFSICIYYDINNVVKEEHCRGDKTIERKLGKVLPCILSAVLAFALFLLFSFT